MAAVTVIPDAPKLALAWKAWAKHCKLIRRLRFIRELINEREVDVENCSGENDKNESDHREDSLDCLIASAKDSKSNDDNKPSVLIEYSQDYLDNESDSDHGDNLLNSAHSSIHRISNIFGREFSELERDGICEMLLPDILKYGPEQTAVFSNEFARAASGCCPNGCREDKIRKNSLIALKKLAEELENNIEQSYMKLKEIQSSNLERDDLSAISYDNDVESQLQYLAPTSFGAQDFSKIQGAIFDGSTVGRKKDETNETISSGIWSLKTLKTTLLQVFKKPVQETILKVDELKSMSTFAVVTFTSRQAAVAARHCLADGRGVEKWIAIEEIPVPPLADSNAFDCCECRGCCRPVTLTINVKQKAIRNHTMICLIICVFLFWTIPFTLVSSFAIIEKIGGVIPDTWLFSDRIKLFLQSISNSPQWW